MKRLRVALALGLVAAFSVLATSPAQAYPEVQVTVSQRTVTGGNDILIEANVVPTSINCTWTVTFLGQEQHGSGNSFSGTFNTPVVDHTETHDATATCVYEVSALGGGSVGSLGASLATVSNEVSGTGTQTLKPRGDDDNGDSDDDGDGDGDGGNGGDGGDNGGLLPNTGGERLAWLIIGGMLVVVGGGVVVASRRRDA